MTDPENPSGVLREARASIERGAAHAASFALSLATTKTDLLGRALVIFDRASPLHDVYHWRVGVTRTKEEVLAAFDRAISLADQEEEL